jgi:hypothetical protein
MIILLLNILMIILTFYLFIYLFLILVLEMEPRDNIMTGKCSTMSTSPVLVPCLLFAY